MALLLLSPSTVSFLRPPGSCSPADRAVPTTTNASLRLATRLQCENLSLTSMSAFAVHSPFGKMRPVVARAAAETGAEEAGNAEPEQPAAPIETMPLESKLKMTEEQRLRMKLAKKLRQRRKRLVRKRRLRKKGRWPPSKMRKLKNV